MKCREKQRNKRREIVNVKFDIEKIKTALNKRTCKDILIQREILDFLVEQAENKGGSPMFCVMLDENKSLLLSDATTAKVNEDKGHVSFFDGYGNLISLFRLNEIIGFHEMS